jgi:hypothetical protein
MARGEGDAQLRRADLLIRETFAIHASQMIMAFLRAMIRTRHFT